MTAAYPPDMAKRKPLHVRMREWADTFEDASAAYAAAAALIDTDAPLEDVEAAWLHARDVNRAARRALPMATWLEPDEIAAHDAALAGAEAVCNRALVALQGGIPYRVEG